MLYLKYCKENPNLTVSWGTFLAVKPFYVRHTDMKDLEMCCCKLHLHARLVIAAIIECAKKQNIELPLHDCQSFFEYLMEDCQKEQHAYISWKCTPDHRTICDNMKSKWNSLKALLVKGSANAITVHFLQFEKLPFENKKGEVLHRLKAVKKDVNMVGLSDRFCLRVFYIIETC